MNFTVEKPGVIGVLTVDGEVTIPCAGELKAALLKSLDSVSHVRLNFEKTTAVDLTCLQLLYSAHLTSTKVNKRITMTGCSEPFQQAVVNGGYSHIKGCVLECEKNCFAKEGG